MRFCKEEKKPPPKKKEPVFHVGHLYALDGKTDERSIRLCVRVRAEKLLVGLHDGYMKYKTEKTTTCEYTDVTEQYCIKRID